MLDEYLWGHIERISPEAPVPILSITHRTSTLGGAGNVAENLRHWGAEATLIGVVGQDETGSLVHDLLRAHGINAKGVLTEPSRKTTRKARLMSVEHGQQVFRLDEESTFTVNDGIEKGLIDAIQNLDRNIQAIVCSDYLKGVLSERVLAAVFEVARGRGIRSIAAPKDSNAEKYRGANILMPNSAELRQLAAQRTNANEDTWLNDSARSLVEVLSLQALLVTRGSEGMSLFENSSAGIKVGKRGTACVDVEEIRASLKEVAARPGSD